MKGEAMCDGCAMTVMVRPWFQGCVPKQDNVLTCWVILQTRAVLWNKQISLWVVLASSPGVNWSSPSACTTWTSGATIVMKWLSFPPSQCSWDFMARERIYFV